MTCSRPVEEDEEIISLRRSVGQNVTFHCSSQNGDSTDWWYYQPGESDAHQISSVGSIINGFKIEGRLSLRGAFDGDSSLRIRNVSQSDSGDYVCRTQQDDDDVQHKFQFTVLRK